MGTPNSKSNDSKLLQLLIDGKSLSWEQVVKAELDFAYLERYCELIRPQLPYLGTYRPLSEQFGAPGGSPIQMFIEKHCLTESVPPCLRLHGCDSSGRMLPYALLLDPQGHKQLGGDFVHLFLTKNGSWIVVQATERGFSVSTNRSVKELFECIADIEALNFKLLKPQGMPVAFQIAQALDLLVQKRVEERQQQLASMEAMQEKMLSLQARVMASIL